MRAALLASVVLAAVAGAIAAGDDPTVKLAGVHDLSECLERVSGGAGRVRGLCGELASNLFSPLALHPSRLQLLTILHPCMMASAPR